MTRAFNSCEIAVEFSLRLSGLLRNSGIRLGTLQTISCTKAIAMLEAVDHGELLRICRVTLINRKEDLFHLERLFTELLDTYLSPSTDAGEDPSALQKSETFVVSQPLGMGELESLDDAGEPTEIEGYSTHEVDRHKDFRLIPEIEFPAVLKELEFIARKHLAITRRKMKKARRGRLIDLRSSARTSARFDGEIVLWCYRRRIPTITPLVIVVDVSGSMEIYSVFLLNFLHLLSRNRWLKIEVFIFSTDLQSMTAHFRRKNFRAVLDSVSKHFSGWSGGTKIGEAIKELNTTYATAITPKTVVTIISDGWDTGDAELLDHEMAKVAGRAKSIVWINPLKGDPGYEPLAQGMAIARPYCNEFISGHSIDSFDRFASLLEAEA
ncbi:MAG: VWA domain-containing protein [Gammaproteobacteria bacterium]|nr:VWA domain-containing protein [Gammaproteobacteria bacterium]